nr:hypothetical protein Iba_chr05fCG11960 [Ipomoea batatas]
MLKIVVQASSCAPEAAGEGTDRTESWDDFRSPGSLISSHYNLIELREVRDKNYSASVQAQTKKSPIYRSPATSGGDDGGAVAKLEVVTALAVSSAPWGEDPVTDLRRRKPTARLGFRWWSHRWRFWLRKWNGDLDILPSLSVGISLLSGCAD